MAAVERDLALEQIGAVVLRCVEHFLAGPIAVEAIKAERGYLRPGFRSSRTTRAHDPVDGLLDGRRVAVRAGEIVAGLAARIGCDDVEVFPPLGEGDATGTR
ncbi:hypothetical protein D3C87_1652270 [compost metagenome]